MWAKGPGRLCPRGLSLGLLPYDPHVCETAGPLVVTGVVCWLVGRSMALAVPLVV